MERLGNVPKVGTSKGLSWESNLEHWVASSPSGLLTPEPHGTAGPFPNTPRSVPGLPTL